MPVEDRPPNKTYFIDIRSLEAFMKSEYVNEHNQGMIITVALAVDAALRSLISTVVVAQTTEIRLSYQDLIGKLKALLGIMSSEREPRKAGVPLDPYAHELYRDDEIDYDKD